MQQNSHIYPLLIVLTPIVTVSVGIGVMKLTADGLTVGTLIIFFISDFFRYYGAEDCDRLYAGK